MQQKWKKLIRALHQKKHRQSEGLFLVEGEKAVLELLSAAPSHLPFEAVGLFYTPMFAQSYPRLIGQVAEGEMVGSDELAQIGTLQSNDAALAVVEIPTVSPGLGPLGSLTLALDDLRDPGNLGAVIRIADWYGIGQIVCSQTTVEWYSPKVIAASMGSFLRVRPHYTDLEAWLLACEVPVLGAFMNGQSIHQIRVPDACVLLIGNEAKGISPSIAQLVSRQVTIPRFGGAESLNAAMATAILCDNLKRGSR